MEISKGPQLWKEAIEIIPGGTQLLSKTQNRFLPGSWPTYFRRANGVEVEDLDGNKFIDMSIMGVGSCTLGYADPDVNAAVKKVIDDGSMCTLNSPEEVELAKLLLSIHPWAGMVRYSRTGGESMVIAVRIARAHTKREVIAICGYHGWHDWYLSTNLASDQNLDGHLLPGLAPSGIPRGLLNTAVPFEYNNIQQLIELTKKYKIAAIVMEPYRNNLPTDNFLQKVRQIASDNGAILIFDEITSGWRMEFAGTHIKLGVTPDIVVYAKAMSNGYPMGAVIGKKEVMNSAQDTFISSTYWTERVGPTAAIATIKKMKSLSSWVHITKIGDMIIHGWETLAAKNGLKVHTHGPSALAGFVFDYPNAEEIRTLFTQEMLDRGYLAGLSVYVSYAHKESHVRDYLKAVDEVFASLNQSIDTGSVKGKIRFGVASTGFKRLN